MNKKISIGLAIALALIAMTVTFSITFVMSQRKFTVTMNSVREREKMYDKLAEIDKYVRDTYYGEINDDTLFDMLSAGYILGIGDRNAAYYTAEQYAELLEIQEGKIMGIGVEVMKDASSGGYARVTRVYTGSPAEEVGLKKGDLITRIDDTEVRGLTKDAVDAKLRGEEGTTVTLSYINSENVTRDGLQVQRRKFDATTVDFQLLDSGYGYIKINTFNNSTPSDFDGALRQLMDRGAKGLVLDVRGNTGGLLSTAVKCVDLLAPEGTVAQARYKDGSLESMGESDENMVDLPMVVLVNSQTASSAELFAASLREFGRAQIVGTKTTGKWTIQDEPHRLSDGSAVSVTIAELLTGGGECYNGTGVTPDVEASLKTEEEQLGGMLEPAADSVVQRAVSLLSTGSADQSASSQPSSQPASEPASQPASEPAGDSAAE